MSIHGTVKSSYIGFLRSLSNDPRLDYKWFLEQEVDTWSNWVPLRPHRRLWLWRHGFTSPCGKLYDFDAYDPEAFLSDLQQLRLYESINGGHRYLLDDKLSQHWMLADYPEHRPTAFGLVDRGHVHGIADTAYDGEPVPVSDWLPEAVRRESRVVLKQLRGLGGKEVLVCAYDDGFVLDGNPVTEAELCEEVAELSCYLATEYVHQHSYADDLYPHAPNTIRILTVWDDEAGELLFAAAVHRIGTERSRPIDNFSRGGLSAPIDPETSELGRAASNPRSGEVPRYATHPDTGAQIEGASIPHWETVRSTVERIALDNTNIPMIGWDILVDESGEAVVIEANTGCEFDLLQVHGPLLEDDRVAAVVSRHLPGVDEP